MEWINICLQKPDENKIHFLTNGRTVFLKGTPTQPFYFLFYGECTAMAEFEPTHWIAVPDLPNKNSENENG